MNESEIVKYGKLKILRQLIREHLREINFGKDTPFLLLILNPDGMELCTGINDKNQLRKIFTSLLEQLDSTPVDEYRSN